MSNQDPYDPIAVGDVHDNMMMHDPAYRAAHQHNAPKYALIEAMLQARSETGMTLEEIAGRMGSTKSSLSRMLSGSQIPNWSTVARFAEAIGKKPLIQFVD